MFSSRSQIYSLADALLTSEAWVAPASYLEETAFLYWVCDLRKQGRIPPDSDGDVAAARSLAKSLAKQFPDEFAKFRLNNLAIHTLGTKETVVSSLANEAGLLYMVPVARLSLLGDRYGFFSQDGQLVATIDGFADGVGWLKAYCQAKELADACKQSKRGPRSLTTRI